MPDPACRSQTRVIFLEDRHHLRPAELGRYVRIGREHLTLLRAGDRNMILRIVGTGLRRRHSVTLPAVKSDVDLQRFSVKRAVPQLVEDVMRIEGTVVIADAGVVAPDDQVRAAKILANEGMKQRLARTRIAHLDRIARLNDRSGAEIIVDHRLDRSGANLGWNVAGLQLPKHLMDENTVGSPPPRFSPDARGYGAWDFGSGRQRHATSPFQETSPATRQDGYRGSGI